MKPALPMEPGIYLGGEYVSDLLHPTGSCTCFGEGECTWCLDAVERERLPDEPGTEGEP